MLVDKIVVQQIFGSLMQKPQFLSEVDKYRFGLDDFSNRFEKYIFSAIKGLHDSGSTKITAIDVENYLTPNDSAKKNFESQNGIEYLQDAEDLCNIENFSFYYNKLKKMNLLRDLKKRGYDISNFYMEDLTSPKAEEINARFEELTLKEIVDGFKKELTLIESEYVQTEEVQVVNVAEDIDSFIEELNETVEVGMPIQGNIYNQVISGAQKGCLTIRSGASGTGKTRNAVADACYLAYPIRYNSSTCTWDQKGNSQKVLFIITEQTIPQVKKMILAYLTDMNESRFKFGSFSDEEKEIIEKAMRIMKQFEKNFILIKIPNPNIELVKVMIREQCLINDIDHVFYDYIFISTGLLSEFKGFNLRNDELLLLFATALKDLAVELDVSVMTSTQVNASADDNKNIRNEASLAGGRSTINKADNGAIMARPTKEELESLQAVTSIYGTPNLVTDIFKVRSGQWTQVRIWSIVDLGRMKREDLFITDARLDTVDNFFEEANYQITNWEDGQYFEIKRMVDEFNEKNLS